MTLSFALKSKAYKAMGSVGEQYRGFTHMWEYNQLSEPGTRVDSYTGGAAWSNVVFTIQDKAYVGAGEKS